ncbi:MAG: dTDP-4-dehydrorhamnose reductase [Deltaproteobacteria bacterium]|nr:dTDP-4-dehydrorhamnose reductase [Deltaproteobacteria bacterium]
MKILLVGGKGMLGSDCKEVLSQQYDVVAPEKKELDIISWDKVIETLQSVKPDIVLNCAAFTDVDACEKESFKVRKVNIEGPRNLAQASARYECKMIHISSDYVFDGKKMPPQPYFEDDTMSPISAYGQSKMESEIAVKENAPDYIIIRTGWLYGINGNNFIKSILRNTLGKKKKKLQVITDQIGSATWTRRLALQIRELISKDAMGTFHATAEGYCTRYEFAEYVFQKLGLKISLQPCKIEDLTQPAKRPKNCILENRLLKKQGLNMMVDWEKDLDAFLERYGEELVKKAKAGTL